MANIHISRDEHLLTIAAEGDLSTGEVVATISEHYPSLGDRSILWELTRADMRSLTKDGFAQIAAAARHSHPMSGSRKTAFAVADTATYLKMCKYCNDAMSAHVAVEYHIFT